LPAQHSPARHSPAQHFSFAPQSESAAQGAQWKASHALPLQSATRQQSPARQTPSQQTSPAAHCEVSAQGPHRLSGSPSEP
jgi:hypothetical protein